MCCQLQPDILLQELPLEPQTSQNTHKKVPSVQSESHAAQNGAEAPNPVVLSVLGGDKVATRIANGLQPVSG